MRLKNSKLQKSYARSYFSKIGSLGAIPVALLDIEEFKFEVSDSATLPPRQTGRGRPQSAVFTEIVMSVFTILINPGDYLETWPVEKPMNQINTDDVFGFFLFLSKLGLIRKCVFADTDSVFKSSEVANFL